MDPGVLDHKSPSWAKTKNVGESSSLKVSGLRA